MNNYFAIYDSKADLFVAYDTDKKAWIWTNFDKLKENIPYSLVSVVELEEFPSRLKERRFMDEFNNLIMIAMPNVWLVKMIDDSTHYRVDYSNGVKVVI